MKLDKLKAGKLDVHLSRGLDRVSSEDRFSQRCLIKREKECFTLLFAFFCLFYSSHSG